MGYGFYTAINESELDIILLCEEYVIHGFNYGFCSLNNEKELDFMLLDNLNCFGFYTSINEFELDAILLSEDSSVVE